MKHPTIKKTEKLEISRVAHMSLDRPYVCSMTTKEAVEQNMFHTSRGTMDVDVHVLTGQHAGARAYLDGVHVRAHYDPEWQTPDGKEKF